MPRDLLASVSGKLAPRDLIAGLNQPPGVPEFNPGVAGYDPKTGEVTPQYGPAGSAAMGAADTGSLGFGDELASYLGSLISGKPRDQVLAEMRGDANAAKTQNPGSYLAGQIAGGVAQTAATGGAGLGTTAARTGAGLGKIALGSAMDAGALGGVYGAGEADGSLADRAKGAALGATIGTLTGGAAPLAVAGARTLASPLLAPVMARLNPGDYANKVLNTTAARAGMSGDDIANMLSRAQADNQGMFSVADALGHQGGRALSTVVRNPNDARQQIVDALADRQMGQGERLSNFLAEGFGAPDTAAQRAASLGTRRATDCGGQLRSGESCVWPGRSVGHGGYDRHPLGT